MGCGCRQSVLLAALAFSCFCPCGAGHSGGAARGSARSSIRAGRRTGGTTLPGADAAQQDSARGRARPTRTRPLPRRLQENPRFAKPQLDIPCRNAILISIDTGDILYEKEPDAEVPMASITKIMTLLLTLEAVEAGKISMTDIVPISEHAFNMGGSQIWLEPGEQFTLDELIKAICVCSANDAAVAVAEFVGGSEPVFAEMMNARAAELGMTHTRFVNACGLDAEGHYSSARDVAAMSLALLRHPKNTGIFRNLDGYAAGRRDAAHQHQQNAQELCGDHRPQNGHHQRRGRVHLGQCGYGAVWACWPWCWALPPARSVLHPPRQCWIMASPRLKPAHFPRSPGVRTRCV